MLGVDPGPTTVESDVPSVPGDADTSKWILAVPTKVIEVERVGSQGSTGLVREISGSPLSVRVVPTRKGW